MSKNVLPKAGPFLQCPKVTAVVAGTDGPGKNRESELMPHVIKLAYKTPEMEEQFRQLCTEILAEFRLPNRRLLCFFDDAEHEALHKLHGDFDGIHVEVGPRGIGNVWPRYVQEHLGMTQPRAAFDNLIYIPGRKYAKRRDSLALIFAHEVQHFLQSTDEPTVYSINCKIAERLDIFTQLKPWNIPHETDAMQRSKQVGNALLGNDAVDAFTTEQIEDATNSNNSSKLALWQFFQRLPSDDSLNIREATLLLLARSETKQIWEMPDSFQKLIGQLQAVPSK
jgi:hypothetical protein